MLLSSSSHLHYAFLGIFRSIQITFGIISLGLISDHFRDVSHAKKYAQCIINTLGEIVILCLLSICFDAMHGIYASYLGNTRFRVNYSGIYLERKPYTGFNPQGVLHALVLII